MPSEIDVVIVGGGIGGLVAAAHVARRGLSCVVLERSGFLGGRAATSVRDGFSMNLGGHALYRGGPAERALAELGVAYQGNPPALGGVAVLGAETFALPSNTWTLLRTRILDVSGKLALGRLLARLPSMSLASLYDVSLSAWLDANLADPRARAIVEMFVRLSTYANAPSRVSAGAALAQLRLASRLGVLYLDSRRRARERSATSRGQDCNVQWDRRCLSRRCRLVRAPVRRDSLARTGRDPRRRTPRSPQSVVWARQDGAERMGRCLCSCSCRVFGCRAAKPSSPSTYICARRRCSSVLLRPLQCGSPGSTWRCDDSRDEVPTGGPSLAERGRRERAGSLARQAPTWLARRHRREALPAERRSYERHRTREHWRCARKAGTECTRCGGALRRRRLGGARRNARGRQLRERSRRGDGSSSGT
jgi:hypothetical protein